ncbi:MAG: hypothetical protein QOH58_2842 [Thermoleophilaceae bacterium]|jgi:hypothetical protein|nr:hypothetical protein [Thermoleophilaceae bacterium]
MSRILLALTGLLTTIALAAGCGSDGSSSSGAASLAPAGSLVYGEATLNPDDDQKASIDALIEKFPGEGSAGDRIRGLLEEAFSGSETGLSFAEDIEPWLGDEAGFFVSRITPAGSGSAVLLVAAEDEGKAQDALEKAAKGKGKVASYKDHGYYAFTGDGAAGVVDGWVVLGNTGGFKAAVDTAEGGKPIEDDERYTKTLEDAPEERLGFVYFNTPAFVDQLQKAGPGAALGPFGDLFKDPVVATLNANEHGVRLEATLPESLRSAFPILSEGSDLAGELPADSWIALAQPDLGKSIDQFVGMFADAAGGRGVLAQQLKAATGLDLDRDVIAWMGDWSLFVRGTSIAELNGALIIETSDEAASGRFIDAIAGLARKTVGPDENVRPLELDGGGEGVTLHTAQVPEPIHLLQRDGKVVLAYGDAAAEDALGPAEKLADSAGYKDAQEALGGDYDLSFYLAFQPIFSLVESLGVGDDEGWQKAKPYLEPLGALVAGARKDGDKLRSAFGITVK